MNGKENFYYVFYNGQKTKAMRWSELLLQKFPSYALIWTKGMSGWKPLDQYMREGRSAIDRSKVERYEHFVSAVPVITLFQRIFAAFLDLLMLLTLLYIFRVLFLLVYIPDNASAAFTFLFRLDLQSYLIVLLVIFYFLSGWVYFALFESSRMKATPGKILVQLQVISVTHTHITLAQATIRYWSKILSIIPLFLGFIMILWNPRRQSLHDIFSCSYVVNNNM
ncbi:MAG: RDD family protein [bacterium]